MSIKLFEHNQTAFDDALEMLEETGKAAVVHPTGTGKSYIGFKLCEQFSDSTICWLSPSEYIYKTQLENLKEDSNGWQPENVKFFTYAKLMLMTDSELVDIKPDYIILDEFHRCGAEMWGEGVNRLLAMYPDVPLLGLTATAIRYLDNQRNMVEELFDGNIASEMALGEAIVRGILNPPKYVLSVFAYQEDYDKLKRRVSRSKNKAVKDKAEQYLDSLRRALEMADGMDVIFDKHITDRTGKYIVFCSNIDHLREMQSNVAAWFSKIDRKPHIYTAYSLDSSTEQEFDDFKKDESDHLKLLFCIDMLNEGVHVENISGVILFRPTVSPIIYKQQIGRALSASKTKDPIIFDIVNNIENLASIDTVQKEMRIAISYYRERGESNYVVNEHFQVIDEVRDAKELFDQLNDCLTSNWDVMFSVARNYYSQNGHLVVPVQYKTMEGYSLGKWIATQRAVYSGERNGVLTPERIAKLESIGMRWIGLKDISFQKRYEAAKRYYEENGNLQVPHDYVTEDGIKLGVFITNLRVYRRAGSTSSYITPERIKMLDSIGMIWDVPTKLWEENYRALLHYYEVNGDIDLPVNYTTEDGINLYTWLKNLKEAYRNRNSGNRIENYQIEALEKLGIDWRTKADQQWAYGYEQACKYKERFGNLSVHRNYKTEDGFALGNWIQYQRTHYTNGKLKQERVDLLNSIGMIWKGYATEEEWSKRFELASAYYETHGNLNIPRRYVVNGIALGTWLKFQRQIRAGMIEGKALTDEQIAQLDSIGMRWDSYADSRWEEMFAVAKEEYDNRGGLNFTTTYITPDGKQIGRWLKNQLAAYENGRLDKEQIAKLDSIGLFEWEKTRDPWYQTYSLCMEYYRENGDLMVSQRYTTESGVKLGLWVYRQREVYRKGMLSDEKIKLLNDLHMVWDVSQYRRPKNRVSA